MSIDSIIPLVGNLIHVATLAPVELHDVGVSARRLVVLNLNLAIADLLDHIEPFSERRLPFLFVIDCARVAGVWPEKLLAIAICDLTMSWKNVAKHTTTYLDIMAPHVGNGNAAI